MLRVPGSVSEIKRLIELLESTVAPLQVQEVSSPNTLVGFIKKALKDEILTPLLGRTAQGLLSAALAEAGNDEAIQVRWSWAWARFSSARCRECFHRYVAPLFDCAGATASGTAQCAGNGKTTRAGGAAGTCQRLHQAARAWQHDQSHLN